MRRGEEPATIARASGLYELHCSPCLRVALLDDVFGRLAHANATTINRSIQLAQNRIRGRAQEAEEDFRGDRFEYDEYAEVYDGYAEDRDQDRPEPAGGQERRDSDQLQSLIHSLMQLVRGGNDQVWSSAQGKSFLDGTLNCLSGASAVLLVWCQTALRVLYCV